MSIIRELITRIAFQVDPKGIKEFNKAIIGFKTKFALATTAVTGFSLGILKSASLISDNILNTNELARSIGVATDQFVGLQRAAGRYRITTQEFNSGMLFLNEQLRLARYNEGELVKEARNSGFEFRKANGEVKDQVELFYDILAALARIPNVADRQTKALKLLGSRRFADVAITNIDDFKTLAEQLKPIGEEILKAEESAKNFDQTLRTLYDTAEKFKLKFATPVLDGLTKILNAFDRLTTKLESYFKAYAESVEQSNKFPGGINPKITDFFRELNTVRPDLFPEKGSGSNRNDVRVNTINVTINGEVGIQNKEAGELMIRNGFMSALEQVFSEIGNNNPVYE